MDTNNKEKPVKRRKKYKRTGLHWKTKLKLERNRASDSQELLSFIISGVDRLSIGDKARVFAHILGKDMMDENQLWAIHKILG